MISFLSSRDLIGSKLLRMYNKKERNELVIFYFTESIIPFYNIPAFRACDLAVCIADIFSWKWRSNNVDNEIINLDIKSYLNTMNIVLGAFRTVVSALILIWYWFNAKRLWGEAILAFVSFMLIIWVSCEINIKIPMWCVRHINILNCARCLIHNYWFWKILFCKFTNFYYFLFVFFRNWTCLF